MCLPLNLHEIGNIYTDGHLPRVLARFLDIALWLLSHFHFLCRVMINNVNVIYTKQQLIVFRLLFSTYNVQGYS